MAWIRSAAFLLGFLALSACNGDDHACTLMGCFDGVSLVVRTADGTWPDGAYTLTVKETGTLHTCNMTVPDDLPATLSPTEVACDPPLSWQGLELYQDATCQQHSSGDAVSQSCTPIPGQYLLRGFLQSTPGELTVVVSRDGVTLLEQSVAPGYVEDRPNGEGCEPTCQTAAVELTLP